MSNPAVCFLASTEIDGINFRIEDNIGEAVHIHIGKLRIALSIDDFLVFAEGIMEAVQQLFQIRHININMKTLDVWSLKEEWIKHYGGIQSVQVEQVSLGSLYMKESYVRHRAIKRIIPLGESGYIKLLKGDYSDIGYYEEPGKLEPSRKQKLDFIKQKIGMDGYPWDGKLILVDQDGYIFDGIKRASYLHYLYGDDGEIPVLRIYLSRQKALKKYMEEAECEVESWNKKHGLLEYNLNDGVRHNQYLQKSMNASLVIGLREFIACLKETGIPFLMIERDKKNSQGERIAIATIVVEEGSLELVCNNLNEKASSISPYVGYEFLYTAPEPLCYQTLEGPILIFDRLCCKNKFEKSILPVDRYILKKMWALKVWNEDWECYCMGAEIYMLIILMDALFECGHFEQKDIDYIEKHGEILQQKEFLEILEREFFLYTPVLVKALLLRQYNAAILKYDKFSDY